MAKKEMTPEVDAETIETPEETLFPSGRAADKKHEREQKLKAIQFLSLPRKKSQDLLGVEFDIVDAVRSRINDSINVSFLIKLKDDAQVYVVSKTLNVFTESYLDYFESFDKDETIEPMSGYTFVELSEGGKAGNKPITLRKL